MARATRDLGFRVWGLVHLGELALPVPARLRTCTPIRQHVFKNSFIQGLFYFFIIAGHLNDADGLPLGHDGRVEGPQMLPNLPKPVCLLAF